MSRKLIPCFPALPALRYAAPRPRHSVSRRLGPANPSDPPWGGARGGRAAGLTLPRAVARGGRGTSGFRCPATRCHGGGAGDGSIMTFSRPPRTRNPSRGHRLDYRLSAALCCHPCGPCELRHDTMPARASSPSSAAIGTAQSEEKWIGVPRKGCSPGSARPTRPTRPTRRQARSPSAEPSLLINETLKTSADENIEIFLENAQYFRHGLNKNINLMEIQKFRKTETVW